MSDPLLDEAVALMTAEEIDSPQCHEIAEARLRQGATADWVTLNQQATLVGALELAEHTLTNLCQSFDLDPEASPVVRQIHAALQSILASPSYHCDTPEDQLNLMVAQAQSLHAFLVRATGLRLTVEVNLYDHINPSEQFDPLCATAPACGFTRDEWRRQKVGGSWNKGDYDVRVTLLDGRMPHTEAPHG